MSLHTTADTFWDDAVHVCTRCGYSAVPEITRTAAKTFNPFLSDYRFAAITVSGDGPEQKVIWAHYPLTFSTSSVSSLDSAAVIAASFTVPGARRPCGPMVPVSEFGEVRELSADELVGIVNGAVSRAYGAERGTLITLRVGKALAIAEREYSYSPVVGWRYAENSFNPDQTQSYRYSKTFHYALFGATATSSLYNIPIAICGERPSGGWTDYDVLRNRHGDRVLDGCERCCTRLTAALTRMGGTPGQIVSGNPQTFKVRVEA